MSPQTLPHRATVAPPISRMLTLRPQVTRLRSAEPGVREAPRHSLCPRSPAPGLPWARWGALAGSAALAGTPAPRRHRPRACALSHHCLLNRLISLGVTPGLVANTPGQGQSLEGGSCQNTRELHPGPSAIRHRGEGTAEPSCPPAPPGEAPMGRETSFTFPGPGTFIPRTLIGHLLCTGHGTSCWGGNRKQVGRNSTPPPPMAGPPGREGTQIPRVTR